MEDKICKICGKTFKPKVHNELCCSVECRKENNRRIHLKAMKVYQKRHREKVNAYQKEYKARNKDKEL